MLQLDHGKYRTKHASAKITLVLTRRAMPFADMRKAREDALLKMHVHVRLETLQVEGQVQD